MELKKFILKVEVEGKAGIIVIEIDADGNETITPTDLEKLNALPILDWLRESVDARRVAYCSLERARTKFLNTLLDMPRFQ